MPTTGPTTYRITVSAEPSPAWASWFEGSHLAREPNGETTLMVDVPDQAALHGILARLRDLGLPLVAIHPVEAEATL